MNSQHKRTRLMDQTEISVNADGEGKSKDWIDELPSCIVSYILSLIAIKDAWDASMVSRRWQEQLWNSILTRPNLEFDIPNIFGSRYAGAKFSDTTSHSLRLIFEFPRHEFTQRVNAVLKHYRCKKVESFKVAFFLDGSTVDLDNWVRFAITKGVEVLHLHLFAPGRGIINYVFPCGLLSELKSSTLKHLSLHRCILRPSPDHFDRFNQLTSLFLEEVEMGETFLQACIFSVCLSLESLNLSYCKLDSCLIVSSSLLRLHELKLLYCDTLSKIEISALSLTSFEFAGFIIPTISIIQAPRLSRIYFYGMDRNAIANANAFTQFAATPALETLQLLTYQELPQSIATFRNLKLLDLYIGLQRKSDYNVHDLMLVLNLLRSTPLLEELVIKLCHPKYPEKKQQERTVISGVQPDCLKRVEMQGFQSNACEMEFAICLLNYSLKLEIMVIDPFGDVYLGGDRWGAINTSNSSKSPHSWEEQRAFVQKELEKVKTRAQVIVL